MSIYFVTLFINNSILALARDPFIADFLGRLCEITVTFLCKQRFHGPYELRPSLSSQVLVPAEEAGLQHVHE